MREAEQELEVVTGLLRASLMEKAANASRVRWCVRVNAQTSSRRDSNNKQQHWLEMRKNIVVNYL